MFYFVLTVCLANALCNDNEYLFTRAEVTENQYCSKEINDFHNWLDRGHANPKSDKLTFKMSCHIIQEKG